MSTTAELNDKFRANQRRRRRDVLQDRLPGPERELRIAEPLGPSGDGSCWDRDARR